MLWWSETTFSVVASVSSRCDARGEGGACSWGNNLYGCLWLAWLDRSMHSTFGITCTVLWAEMLVKVPEVVLYTCFHFNFAPFCQHSGSRVSFCSVSTISPLQTEMHLFWQCRTTTAVVVCSVSFFFQFFSTATLQVFTGRVLLLLARGNVDTQMRR